MTKRNHRSHEPERRMGLGLLALLLVPLLLILHAPVLAAIVPGALLTVASLDARAHRERHALPSATIVGVDDREDLRRLDKATPIEGRTRRVS
ncbi:MAG: hypothetical protein R6X02_08790 [Enhygromyxa sp.]